MSFHLAALYDVEVRTLIQAVKRNIERFPEDFMFQLTEEEYTILKSQIVISSGHGGARALPYAFTEQGVAMLSGVLKSEKALAVNIAIMRAFVRLRELIESNQELSRRIEELEKKMDGQDEAIQELFNAIRHLLNPPIPARKPIGFKPS